MILEMGSSRLSDGGCLTAGPLSLIVRAIESASLYLHPVFLQQVHSEDPPGLGPKYE